MRGLKPLMRHAVDDQDGRTLTGAWIETICTESLSQVSGCRTLTGAWIETCATGSYPCTDWCRTLTGAWIETYSALFQAYSTRRTLTGAWIETTLLVTMIQRTLVAPSRVRGLKQ